MNIYIKDPLKKINIDISSLSVNEVRDHFMNLSDDHLSFLGIIDINNEIIRFLWSAKNKWLVDHPVIAGSLHQQRYATLEASIILIEKIFQQEDVSMFNGFTEVPIEEFTLDEMLAFKEEDEALLIEEELPVKTTTAPVTKKTTIEPKKNGKPSIILGDVVVPKEQLVQKIIPKHTSKKSQISPLKQFKSTAIELKKEQSKTAKISAKSTVTKKTDLSKPVQRKTDKNTSLLNLRESVKPEKKEISKVITTHKTLKEKTEHEQTIAKKSSPNTSEKKSLRNSKTTKQKTLHQLGTSISENKKVPPKKSKTSTGKTSKEDTTKPSNDDNSFFSI